MCNPHLKYMRGTCLSHIRTYSYYRYLATICVTQSIRAANLRVE